MIGLDTNVLARLFVDDDADQARLARQFVADHCTKRDPGFVDRVALCEMVWVLSRAHGYDRQEIAEVIDRLLISSDVAIEDPEVVRAALRTFRSSGVDFADTLIGGANRARGCEVTATFDRKAARLDWFVLVT